VQKRWIYMILIRKVVVRLLPFCLCIRRTSSHYQEDSTLQKHLHLTSSAKKWHKTKQHGLSPLAQTHWLLTMPLCLVLAQESW